jgi:hypothetical protein
MLTEKGLLTDIGSWYLGGAVTNNIPGTSGASAKTQIGGVSLAAIASIVGLLVLF